MKWNYTTIHFGAMTELGLSALEYILSDITYHRSKAGTDWWAYSPSELGELLGLNENSIRDAVKRCVEKGTINKDSDKLISCQKYIDVVYPPNGSFSRPNGSFSHLQTGVSPAYHNIYTEKNNTSLRSGIRVEFQNPDEDSGDSKTPRVSGNKRKAYDELIEWSEKQRGFPFLRGMRGKQYRAFKMANDNGIPREKLMERWEEMSGEKFWMKSGYDWMNVVASFNTKGHE